MFAFMYVPNPPNTGVPTTCQAPGRPGHSMGMKAVLRCLLDGKRKLETGIDTKTNTRQDGTHSSRGNS